MSDLLSQSNPAGNLSQRSRFTRSSAVSKIDIPANGTAGIPAFGTTFYVLNATAAVEIKTEKTVLKPYKQGQGEVFTPEFEFQRLEFRNPNDFAVSVFCWYGFGEYIDRRFELVDAETVATGSNGTLGPAAGLTFNGVPSGNQVRRKYAVITNLNIAGGAELQIRNIPVAPALPVALSTVFPQNNYVFDSSAGFEIYNDTASNIPFQIAEIWYTTTG